MIDFDLRETLAAVVEEGRVEAASGDKDLQLSWHLDDAVPSSVWGDRARVQRALRLIVGRAVDASLRGNVRVGALLDERSAQGLSVRFEVADEAEPLAQPGLSPEQVFRLGEGDANLALWRQIASLVADELGITSGDDAGNTYWFTVHLGYPGAHHPTES